MKKIVLFVVLSVLSVSAFAANSELKKMYSDNVNSEVVVLKNSDSARGLLEFKSSFVKNRGEQIKSLAFCNLTKISLAATKKYIREHDKSTPDSVAAELGRAFNSQIQLIMIEYGRRGVVLLDSNVVMAAPGGHDVTDEVAAMLGLTQSDLDDVFAK